VQAPDFPTRGIIHGLAGVREGYRTGRGRVVIRARTHFEDIDRGQRQAIVVDELPYQVNKALLQVRINDLMKDKRIEGIAEVRDESDKSGMRLVIELKRGEVPEVVLNTLFKETQMQDSFGMNMVALVDGQPKLLDLKGFLDAFVRHRREVVTRRTVFELRKARERGHILEGLAVALSNVDEIIELIRAAPTPAEAKAALTARRWRSALVESMLERAGAASFRPDGLDETFGAGAEGYRLSDVQAQRILEMQLQRLTGLEQDKILAEYREVMDNISDLLDILARPERVTTIVGDELVQIRTQYGDARRSEITLDTAEIGIEDLITPKDMVVTLSHSGWIKAQPSDDYRAQKRGGRGRRAATVKDADFIETLFAAHSHDTVLAFSNLGKAYSIKVYELPSGGSGSKGKPVVNVFPLEQERGEKITVSLPVPQFDDGHYVFMVTAQGTVKKTSLANFANVRKSGIIAVDLDDGDVLIGAAITGGTHDIMLFADGGKAVRFAEEDVRPMGRTARGVRGMRLPDGRRIISLVVTTDPTQTVLTATENGYGKRTPVADYPRHGRGTQGTIAIQLSERNGKLVGARLVDAVDEVMLITSNGVLIRTPVAPIRELGRNTQGVTLINLDDGDRLVGLERVADREDADALDGDGLAEGATAGDAGPGDDTVGHAVSPDAGSDGVTDGDGSDDA
jgi:DNA gyrase subunit A